MTIQEKIIRLLVTARTQVNVTECPPKSNRGLKVEDYLASCGLGGGYPWCAAFVRWAGKAALGDEWPVPAMAGCASLGEWAASQGRLVKTPVRGVVFLMYYSSMQRFAHTGFVVEPSPQGGWTTIEGNTSGGGSREGWGVFQRTRTFGEHDRFIRWWG